jgi:hypothetical protein
MAKYSASINGVALDTSNDLRTIVTTATGAGSALSVYEILLGGEAASTSQARVAVNRPSAVGSTATTVAPVLLHPASAAAAFSVATTWTTQPTLNTTDVLILDFNAFGGVMRWSVPVEYGVIVGTQGAIANLSIRSRSGTPTVGGHVLVEQF